MKFEGSGSTTTRGSLVTGEWRKLKKLAIFPCSTNEMQRMLFRKPVFFVRKIPERDAFETSSTLQQIMPITAHEAVKDEQARRERAC